MEHNSPLGKPISGNVTEPPGLRRLLDAFRAYINKEIDWWQVEKAAIERDRQHQKEVAHIVLDEIQGEIQGRTWDDDDLERLENIIRTVRQRHVT